MSVSISSYFPNLTGLRGVAAAWVLAFHAWQFAGGPPLSILTPVVKCGYFGVDLFFVLSGFLLSLPFHRAAIERRPRPSLIRFWNHRCRRVLPAYWLQLVILAAAFLWLGHWTATSTQSFAAHALLIQNIAPWQMSMINPVYWSMPVEWDFYLVLPLLVLFFAHVRWQLALAFVFALAVAFRFLCYESATDIGLAGFVSLGDVHQLPARLDQFFIGICAAWVAIRGSLSERGSMLCLIAGVAGAIAMAFVAAPREDFINSLDLPYALFHHSLTALSFGLLILGASSPTRVGMTLFANRPLTFLGFISYSLYLWHYPLLQAIQSAGWVDGRLAPAWVIVMFVALPVILLVSWLSARYVEQPFLRTQPAAASPVVGSA